MIGPRGLDQSIGPVEVTGQEGVERALEGAGHGFGPTTHLGERIGGGSSGIQLGADGGCLAGHDAGLDRSACRPEGEHRPIGGADRSADGGQLVLGIGQQLGGLPERCAGGLSPGHDARATPPRQLERRLDDALELVQALHGGIGPGNHEAARAQPVGRVRCRAGERAARDRHGDDSRCGGADAYHGPMSRIDAVRALPKAELHQHLDGSMRPETAVELAAVAGMPLSLDEARAGMVGPARCRDQATLLEYFDLPIALLQTADALERTTLELVEDLMHDGVRYAEIRWAPRLHLERGLSVADVIEAVARGVARSTALHGPATPLVGLIVTAMRNHPPAANAALAEAAAAAGPPVVGFDLAGPEASWPAPPHALAFDTAREAGLGLTAHAGEVAGAGRIREVLDFGVRRVAHGVTAASDAAVMELLRARDVTLDLCPTSNVQAGIVPGLAEHPIAALHRAGVSVTISTDDRTVTGTTLSEEMVRTAEAVGLRDDELAAIALNGFRRAFAPAALLEPLVRDAAARWDAWRGGTVIG